MTWDQFTEAEEAAAVAELRELAVVRGDLLAEVAGVLGVPVKGSPIAAQAASCTSVPHGRGRPAGNPADLVGDLITKAIA